MPGHRFLCSNDHSFFRAESMESNPIAQHIGEMCDVVQRITCEAYSDASRGIRPPPRLREVCCEISVVTSTKGTERDTAPRVRRSFL